MGNMMHNNYVSQSITDNNHISKGNDRWSKKSTMKVNRKADQEIQDRIYSTSSSLLIRYSGPSILRPPMGPCKCSHILEVALK